MKRGPYKEFLKETDSDEIPSSTAKYRKKKRQEKDSINIIENELIERETAGNKNMPHTAATPSNIIEKNYGMSDEDSFGDVQMDNDSTEDNSSGDIQENYQMVDDECNKNSNFNIDNSFDNLRVDNEDNMYENDLVQNVPIYHENIEENHAHRAMDQREVIHEGCDLTREESKVLIMSTALRHHLTDAALEDLLKLIDCHLPRKCHVSKYLFLKSFPISSYFMINELPYRLRKHHMMITGLWFDSVKPLMNTFLKPFIDELIDLHVNGFQSTTFIHNEPIQIHVHTIVAPVDSIARPMIQCMKQFNGKYGCSYCYHKGDQIQLDNGRGFKNVYTGDVRLLRKQQHYVMQAEKALQTAKPVKGVMNASIAVLLPVFDIISSFPPEYLHSVAEGVVKQFVMAWCDSKNHKQAWSLLCSNFAQDYSNYMDYNTWSVILFRKGQCPLSEAPKPVQSLERGSKDRENPKGVFSYAVSSLEGFSFIPETYVIRINMTEANMLSNVGLIKGRHCLALNENKDITIGPNGGLMICDEISESLLEVPISPEVLSFFDLSTKESQTADDIEKTQVRSSCSNSSSSQAASSKPGSAVWDDNSVKLLFFLYNDHQDDFKSTCIKNDAVWDKIRMRMKSDEGYNYTRVQIKDKWMNMKKNYMKVKDHNKRTGVAPKTYRYYNEMDDLFGDKPNVTPIATASSMKIEDEIALCSKDNSCTVEDDQLHIRKKSKVERHLHSWTDKYIEHTKEQENRREERQKEKIAAIADATKTFRDMMEKLIEKL
ncbi:PREDICTED: uncharacterized protein LOC105462799 [Wasmannia auropunctata]|uniref:uncharacterized protein LOC105462799 n=1 Tax=Wasmannia auropunctata TaxID=64793 RepID=UPI0005ED5696|nr:PREDICTED: uncharacterized protein LOC105462799 [Wasmannia auropunctata]